MRNVMKLFAVGAVAMVASTAQAAFFDGAWLKAGLAKDEKALKEKVPAVDAQDGAMAVGYVVGVADALEGAGVVCTPEGVKVDQLVAMVNKQLAANPDKWNQPADMFIHDALKAAFPCPAK